MVNAERIKSLLPDPSVVIINNPESGPERKRGYYNNRMQELERVLKDRDGLGLRVETYLTKTASHARDVVGNAINKGIGLIIAKGGDGTLAHIADELARSKEHSTHLLAAGGGTQNVFRSNHTRYEDPVKVAGKMLLEGQPVATDVGVIQTGSKSYAFLSNGDVGYGGDLLRKWGEKGKKNILHAVPIFLRDRNKFEPYDMRITFDGKESEMFPRTMVFAFMNVGSYAGLLPLTRSDMTDGILEGIIVPPEGLNNQGLLKLLHQKISKTERVRGLTYEPFKTAKIVVTNQESLVFQHDGEPERTESTELTVSTKPKAVKLWVPSRKISSPAYA